MKGKVRKCFILNWLFVLKSQAISPVLLDCFRNFLAKADVTQADE